MNSDQVGGIVRAIVAAVGGYFIGRGIGSAELWAGIAGAVATLLTAAWSIFTNSTSQMVESVAEKPEVKKVVTTAAIADATSSAKVATT